MNSTLPTDKNGNLYYGETTYAEACRTARNHQDDFLNNEISEDQMISA